MFAGLGALLGAVIGSFIATLFVRWPQNKSVLTGRSACDHCATHLQPRDLLPVVSFIVLRGKCRECGSAINRDHVTIEILSMLIGATAIGLAPDANGVAGAVFGWTLLVLGALDLRHFWLPDQLTGCLAASGIAAGLVGASPPLADRVWGGIAGFMSLFIVALLYRLIRKRDGLGGGDPKLLGAIGLWLGWKVLPAIVLGACFMGLLVVGAGMMRGQRLNPAARIPLGTLLALSAMCTWIVQNIPVQ